MHDTIAPARTGCSALLISFLVLVAGWAAQSARSAELEGRNEVVARLSNYFNRHFNWTGFLFRPEMAN
jgi:hypothetical protein